MSSTDEFAPEYDPITDMLDKEDAAMGRLYCEHLVPIPEHCAKCDRESDYLNAWEDGFAASRAWQAFRDWCGPSRVCVWTQSEFDLWETDCNGAFQLNDGGPHDNDMRFCCYCGGALVERPYEDAEDDDEE